MSDRPHVICATCGRDNPARLTFCEDCGARLSPRAAAPTPPAGIPRVVLNEAPVAAASPVPNASLLAEPKAHGAGVSGAAGGVPAAPDTPADTATRICPRCNGATEPNGSFCRFCGAAVTGSTAAVGSQANGLAPTTPVRARVLSIGTDGQPSASFDLRERLDIGRSEGDVVIGWDPYLSPRHLRLEAREGRLVARDLGTVNGTYLRVRAARPGSTEDAEAMSRETNKFGASPPKDGNGIGIASPTPAAAFEPAVPGHPKPSGKGSRQSKKTGGMPLVDQDLFLLGQQVIRFEVVKDAEAGFGPATQHGTAIFGTPAGPVYARLCQRTVEGVTRDVFHVRKDEIVLGRELGDVVFTDDAFLSRRHAIVRRDPDGGSFSLLDAGSSNGTFLRVRGEVELSGGDEIRIGQQLFRIDEPHLASSPSPRRAS